jgi:hypothetical protein
MSLRQAEHEGILDGAVRPERLTETSKDFFVFMPVFRGKDDERGRSEAVFDAVDRLRCLPGPVLGPPLRPLRLLACR